VGPAAVDALPHGTLVRHPELGHFGPLQAPAVIAADIRRALTPGADGAADLP
jgi:hypothetical protein